VLLNAGPTMLYVKKPFHPMLSVSLGMTKSRMSEWGSSTIDLVGGTSFPDTIDELIQPAAF